jgi:hypothetical protein
VSNRQLPACNNHQRPQHNLNFRRRSPPTFNGATQSHDYTTNTHGHPLPATRKRRFNSYNSGDYSVGEPQMNCVSQAYLSHNPLRRSFDASRRPQHSVTVSRQLNSDMLSYCTAWYKGVTTRDEQMLHKQLYLDEGLYESE